jgi:predicted nucleotidyltransferase
VFAELRGLIRKTFGVAQVLREALKPLARQIRIAFVYGSIAEGSETANSDIDVMVIADIPSLGAVVSAFAEAQRELRREVNPSIYGVDEFCRKLAAGHHFLSSVIKAAKIFLIGDEGEFSALVQERMAQTAQVKLAGDRRSARRGRS